MKELVAVVVGLSTLLATSVAAAPTGTAAAATAAERTHRIVVRYKTGALAVAQAERPAEREARVASAGGRADLSAHTHRVMASGAVVYRLSQALTMQDAREFARQLRLQPDVASAEPDVRVQALAIGPGTANTPNDPAFVRQWSLLPAATGNAGGANFTAAWQRSLGAGITVAVVDSGMLPSADLATKWMPGVDLVSDDEISADGSAGRDSDPSDPGDGCDVKNPDGSVIYRNAATWHGVRVASQIAASTDNGFGIAGGAPAANVQAVRVLGKCGGWLSDIADGISWAAGVPVAGLPANPTPSRVVNLSIGGNGSCPSYMQDAIDAANARKSVVVVAAGNSGSNVLMTPANCGGVVVVAAHTKSGDLAGYSTFGPAVTITAPAGGRCAVFSGAACPGDLTPAIGNKGEFTPAEEDPNATFSGTSAATPHVAATVALMLSLRPELGQAEVRSMLARSAAVPPAGSFCSTNPVHCGAGMLDAGAAVALAAGAVATPFVDIKPVGTLFRRGADVVVEAVAAGAPDFTWTWRQVEGPALASMRADGATLRLKTPTAASGNVTVEVTATSASQGGLSSSARVSFQVNEPPVVPALELRVDPGKPVSTRLGVTDVDDTSLEIRYVGGSIDGLTVREDDGGQLVWDKPAPGRYTFQIVAFDAAGNSRSNNVTLSVEAGATAPTGGSGGADAGGGGGGAAGGGFLMLLAAAVALLFRSAPAPRVQRAAVRPDRRA